MPGLPWPPPLLAGFVALALVVLVFELRWAGEVPGREDWQAAAAAVRTGWEPGDVIRIEPWWATEGLPELRGLPVDRVRRPERRRLVHFRRAWVIAAHGHSCREGALDGAELQVRQVLHRLELCRYGLPYRGKPLYDLRAQLHDARVRRSKDGQAGTEECRLWTEGSWHCGKVHSWQFVGPVIKDVDDSPREAIWAHPPGKDVRLTIEYPAVPLGRELELEAGLTLRSVISGEGSDVHFRAELAGEPVLDTTLAPRQKGWFSWPIDTTRWAGQKLPLKITIWAHDHQVRQVLFAGRSWEE